MTERLHLQPRHRAQLEALLNEHLPDVEVWAYGSRVNAQSHDGSDLDLVLRGPGLREIDIDALADFSQALHDSEIPFLVEARDWARLPERFHREIEREYVVVRGLTEHRPEPVKWLERTWGDLATLEYGKSLRGYREGTGTCRVFGTNGPIGWHTDALDDGPGVVIGRKGAYRGVHYSPEPFFVIDTAFYLKPRTADDLEMRWAYYELLSQDINGLDSGSAIPSTSRNAFYSMPVRLPPLCDQRAIADVLGTLDDKIELNRQMNETLEGMARALFESWFVDFDPVRAKMEGRGTGLPPDVADLFPDRLVDSEMGEIPEEWTHEAIHRFTDIVYGAPFASRQFNTENEGVPLIRIRDLSTHRPSVSTRQVHPKGHRIDPGDIVVGMDGEFRLEIWKGPTSWLNQRVCHFEPKPGIPTSFLAGALQEPLAYFERGKVGTTVIHLGKRDLETIRLLQPSEEVLDVFASRGDALLEKAVAASREARSLAALRDTLLPKLISGEVRVPDTEPLASTPLSAQ